MAPHEAEETQPPHEADVEEEVEDGRVEHALEGMTPPMPRLLPPMWLLLRASLSMSPKMLSSLLVLS